GGIAHADAYGLQFADAAVAHALGGQAEHSTELAALLAAGLEDYLRLLYRVHDGPALGDIVGERLLAIDVLAGAGGLDARDRVPVVRRGDDHGVDVLASQHVAEVVEGVAALVLALAFLGSIPLLNRLLGALPAVRDDVADGHDLHVATAEKA